MNGTKRGAVLVLGILAATAVAIMLLSCEMNGDPQNRASVPAVESIQIMRVSDSWLDFTPVNTSQASPLTVTGIGEARFNLVVRTVPADAIWGFTWESDNPAVWFDRSTFQVVGNTPGYARLTFTSAGTMADGRRATADLYVRSNVLDLDRLIRWNFTSAPAGWLNNGTNNAIQQPFDYPLADRDGRGYNMTLLGTTRTMVVNHNNEGMLRTGGGGNFATITGVQGPFDVRVVFSSGGTAVNDHRWVQVQVGSTWYGVPNPSPSTGDPHPDPNFVTTFGGGRRTVNISHTGAGGNITLNAQGGLFIHEVFVDFNPH